MWVARRLIIGCVSRPSFIATAPECRGGIYRSGLGIGRTCIAAGADVLLPLVQARTVIADKGYDADARGIWLLEQAGKTVVIPPKRNRKVQRTYDQDIYKSRHRIENLFAFGVPPPAGLQTQAVPSHRHPL
jgi:transposase